MNSTENDKIIRALLRRVMELREDSPEHRCLVAEVWANARLAYEDEDKVREKLKLFIAEIIGLKQAEALHGRRLHFQ